MKAIKDNKLDDQINKFLGRKFQEFPDLIDDSREIKHIKLYHKIHDFMAIRNHLNKPSMT